MIRVFDKKTNRAISFICIPICTAFLVVALYMSLNAARVYSKYCINFDNNSYPELLWIIFVAPFALLSMFISILNLTRSFNRKFTGNALSVCSLLALGYIIFIVVESTRQCLSGD